MDQNFLPDFLVIGAGKSGTTSLYYYLKQHPEVFLPEVKEPNFFGLRDKKLRSKEEDPRELEYFPWSVTDLDEYKKLFKSAGPVQKKGDVSPMYLSYPDALPNIRELVPEARLIVILRHPVERLFSRWLHLVRDNRKPTAEFLDALDRNSIWWERMDLVQEGFFYRHLKKYFDAFPESQIKVFLFDDLKNEQDKLIVDLFEFIGVDKEFKPDTSVRFNASGEIRNKALNNLIGRNNKVFNTAKNLLPSVYSGLKKNMFLKKTLNRARNRNLVKVEMKPEERKAVSEIYREDILALEGLIKRDLSHWLE